MTLLVIFLLMLFVVWPLFSVLITWHVASKHPLWAQMPRDMRLKIVFMSPIGFPINVIREWRDAKIIKLKARQAFMRTKLLTSQIDVDTLEGFRSLMASDTVTSKNVKLTGKFLVSSPIEIRVPDVMVDLSESELTFDGPVLWIRATGVVLKDVNIVSELPHLSPVGSVGDEPVPAILVDPEANVVIMGYAQLRQEPQNAEDHPTIGEEGPLTGRGETQG